MHPVNSLISYSKTHKEGFTVRVNSRGTIERLIPSVNHRFVVADKTVIELRNQSIVILENDIKTGLYGGWFDPVNNKFLIERVTTHKSKLNAVRHGQQRKQYSIFDLQQQREIKLIQVVS